MANKILLLNLPFEDRKFQRDFSCPHSSKANYYWPPIDLVVYSAILSDQQLYFIDGIQEKINEEELIKNISQINPDFIFTIISAISLQEDVRFIKKIKSLNKDVIICTSGDLCSFDPKKISSNESFDFIISDFTEREKIRRILFNKQSKKIIDSSKDLEFKIGIPRHELFKKYPYRMPFSFYQPISSIITNYGCPFNCKFCNSNNLKFKSRELKEVIEELKYLEKIGIKEVYIRDFTFGIPKIKRLLRAIIDEKINIKWSCEFRVDLANEDILSLMKKAGCFLIFYGGESGNQRTLDLMKKGFTTKQIIKAIKLTKKLGIETLVSFIIGFPTEKEEDIMKTKKFIMEIDPDYVSINILVPRIGSQFRKESKSKEKKRLDNSRDWGIKYPSGKFAGDIQKKIEKEFFFRPSKILRYFFLSIKTKTRFKNFIQNGISIFFRTKKTMTRFLKS